MKKRLKLELTSEDIDAANSERRWTNGPAQCYCPFAQALTRLSGDGTPGFAAQHVLVFNDKPYKVSRSVRKAMDDFDNGKDVKPRVYWLIPL